MGVAASQEKAEEPSPDTMGEVAPHCPARNPAQPPLKLDLFLFTPVLTRCG